LRSRVWGEAEKGVLRGARLRRRKRRGSTCVVRTHARLRRCVLTLAACLCNFWLLAFMRCLPKAPHKPPSDVAAPVDKFDFKPLRSHGGDGGGGDIQSAGEGDATKKPVRSRPHVVQVQARRHVQASWSCADRIAVRVCAQRQRETDRDRQRQRQNERLFACSRCRCRAHSPRSSGKKKLAQPRPRNIERGRESRTSGGHLPR
jgi:hypothetical protein